MRAVQRHSWLLGPLLLVVAQSAANGEPSVGGRSAWEPRVVRTAWQADSDTPERLRPAAVAEPRRLEDSAPLRSRMAETPPERRAARASSDRWTSGSLAYEEAAAPEPLNLGGLVTRLVLGTVLALAGLVGSLWAARRWLPGQASSTLQRGRLQLIDTLSVAHRCYVQLVEVDGRHVLVGCDAGGLRVITPLPPSFADGWAPDAEPEAADPPHDAAALEKTTVRGTPWTQPNWSTR